MNKILPFSLFLLITACDVELNNSDAIEFGGNSFTYEEKMEITQEAISSIGVEGLTAHMLSEVPEVKASEIKLVDVRIIETPNNSSFVLRCHIEADVSFHKKERLIESCKNKLFNLLQDAERKKKRKKYLTSDSGKNQNLHLHCPLSWALNIANNI